MRDLILHAHFYQPPRENPWTGHLPVEAVTAPFHDWNARIHAECYRPNTAARVCRPDGRIEGIVNNLERLSFNVGPTLVHWLSLHAPRTLARIVRADRRSQERLGAGNAMAQAYNHLILPLAHPRDRRTQIRWGLASFRRTFDRPARGMWLPECGASHDTLEDLIDHGVEYVVLAPGQAARWRPPQGEWTAASAAAVDPGRPYRFVDRRDASRGLAVFFYDGALASGVSFGSALSTSDEMERHVREAAQRTEGLVHAAFDGETMGHHHRFGDRTLAYAAHHQLASEFSWTNYAAIVDSTSDWWEVELEHGPEGEGSAWSCAHGVGRWIRDCGCRIDPGRAWSQAWREPLRAAFDHLRDTAAPIFEATLGAWVGDPWLARDDAIEWIEDPSAATRARFLERHAGRDPGPEPTRRILALLELQHQLLLMYTSCGWFFDDIAGVESVQCLRHAARALELWEATGTETPRAEFLDLLATASSNLPTEGNGADVYRRRAESARVSWRQLAAVTALRPPQPGQRREGDLQVDATVLRSDAAVTIVRVGLEHRRLRAPHELLAVRVAGGGSVSRVRVGPWPGEAEVETLVALPDPARLEGQAEALLGPALDGELAPVLELSLEPPVDLESIQDAFHRRWGLEGLSPGLREVAERLGFAVEPPS